MSLFTSNKDKNQPLQFLTPAFLQGLSSKPGGNLTHYHDLQGHHDITSFLEPSSPLTLWPSPLCLAGGTRSIQGVNLPCSPHGQERTMGAPLASKVTWALQLLPAQTHSLSQATRLHASLYPHLLLQLYPGTV